MYDYDEVVNKYGELFAKELDLERSYKAKAEEAMTKVFDAVQNSTDEAKVASQTKAGQKYIAMQWNAAHTAIKAFAEGWLTPKPGIKPAYVEVLKVTDETFATYYGENGRDKMIDLFTLVTFLTILDSVLKKNSKKSNIAQQIARELQTEVKTISYMCVYEHPSAFEKHIQERVAPTFKKRYVEACMRRAGHSLQGWGEDEANQLAASLVEVMLAATSYFEVDHERVPNIIPTQRFLDGWKQSTDWLTQHSYKYCPTVIPPRDWEANHDGGYYGDLTEYATMLRLHGSRDIFSQEYNRKLDAMELTNVKKAVNAVQATPWKINKQVLAVLEEVKKRGGGMAGIPALGAPAPICPENPTEEQLEAYKKAKVRYYKNETRRKSILLRFNAHLSCAEEYKDFDRIYFPCNMDFRGRIYPIPSFNFQGDDVNKSLILFADAPACQDEVCYKWMLVEGANLAGVDKVSYDDRVQWVLDNEEQILQVADDPFANLWWADQDSPCQFLAWCFEYKHMKQHIAEHGSIIGFVTGLNVAFDGTCSGLQHFSAILRDPVGGQAVNLIPADKPSDIYGIVAAKVNEVLKKDVIGGTEDAIATDKNGDEYNKRGTRFLAGVWLAYGVTRKVTKRSVMTLAYGSKEYGFRDQLKEDIIKADKIANGEKSVFEGCDGQAAAYLAKLIWKAVNTTVISAVQGMKWLQDCSRLVTKNNQVVTWTTPMGLPVQQAYMIMERHDIFTRCAGKQIRLYNSRATGEIDRKKQASGIAPNFIHSMDASHLQLTICNCVDKGIKHFAMIHDSYGAPLAQAQLMYDTVRASFIQMYTENDVFANFLHDMEKLTDEKLPQPPSKGSLDLNCVTDSLYIFS